MVKKTRILPLFALAAASLAGAFFLAGFIVSDQILVPSATVLKVKTAIRNAVKPGDELATDDNKVIWSTFLPLEVNEFEVPVERKGAGGGLTSVGDTLVVLTHEGRLFGLTDDYDVRPLDIRIPDNGYGEYVAAAEGKYAHLTHAPEYFRYNDVLFFKNDERAGLAISYTEWLDDRECYGTAIAVLDLLPGQTDIFSISSSVADWKVIFRTQPCLPLKEMSRAIEGHMAGGRIAFKPPHSIVLGSGDYHWDGMYAPLAYAQDPSNDYGKVIEIEVSSGEARHLSIGNRNVQGITVDKDGEIWAVEHGVRGGDELNKIVDGANFGWPLATLGTRYNKLPIPSAKTIGRHNDFDSPVYAWLPSIGVSNITQIRNFDTSWDDDLLVASLSAQSLFRLRIVDDRVVFSEQIRLGHRIRYVDQLNNETLVLWTDQNKLVRLSKANDSPVIIALDELVDNMRLNKERENRLRANIDNCTKCHSVVVGDNIKAPNLGDILGRKIADTDFRDYSRSLLAASGTWNETELRRFLSDPAAYATGTTMPDPNLPEQSITDLIDALRRLREPE